MHQGIDTTGKLASCAWCPVRCMHEASASQSWLNVLLCISNHQITVIRFHAFADTTLCPPDGPCTAKLQWYSGAALKLAVRQTIELQQLYRTVWHLLSCCLVRYLLPCCTVRTFWPAPGHLMTPLGIVKTAWPSLSPWTALKVRGAVPTFMFDTTWPSPSHFGRPLTRSHLAWIPVACGANSAQHERHGLHLVERTDCESHVGNMV
jgi:hypothetical protein